VPISAEDKTFIKNYYQL